MIDFYKNWEDFFKAEVESNLIWCLDNSPKNLKFHTIDRTIILFLRFVLTNKKNGLVVYPINNLNLTSSLAAESLYQRVPFKNRKKILLIGKNIAIREAFRTLTNANGEPLEQYFPIGIVKYDGSVYNHSKIKYQKKLLSPKILFSSNPNILPNLDYGKDIYLILVEVDSNTPADFKYVIEKFQHEAEIPCLFWITANPYCNQTKELIASEIPYWGWNSHALFFDFNKELIHSDLDNNYDENPFSAPLYKIKNAAEGVKKTIVPVKDNNLNNMLNNAKKNYKNLANMANKKNDSNFKTATKNYLKIIHSFEELTAPLKLSEREFSVTWGIIPISTKIEFIKKQSEDINKYDTLFSSFLISAIEDLNNIYEYLNNTHSGKPSLIVEIIDMSIKKGKKTAIITKNKASKKALSNYLSFSHKLDQDYLKKKGILITSINHSEEIPDIDTCIVFGNPGYYNKKILRCACCKNIGFLAYNSELQALSYLIENEVHEEDKIFSFEKRAESVSKILNVSVEKVKNKISRPPQIQSKRKKIIYIEQQDAQVKDFEIASLSEDLLKFDISIGSDFTNISSSQFIRLEPSSNRMNYKANSNLIKLSSGKCIYIPLEKRTPIFIDHKNDIDYRKGENLAENDLLILINDGLRKSINQEIIATVDKLPKMFRVVAYQRSWIETLRRGMSENNHTPKDVLDLLQQRGSNIETPTAIYFWASGEILGPSRINKENIKFIGEIYNDPFLVENFENIYSSIERLRKIHIRLKRNLGKLMINAGLMIEENMEDQIIDEELNLFLEDFYNSINIERIDSIEGPFEINIEEAEKIFDCYEGYK